MALLTPLSVDLVFEEILEAIFDDDDLEKAYAGMRTLKAHLEAGGQNPKFNQWTSEKMIDCLDTLLSQVAS